MRKGILLISLGLIFLSTNLFAKQIQFIDIDDQGIEAADVMIGSEPDNPFPGNEVQTDAKGFITFPVDWKTNLPLTFAKDNFVTTSFMDTAPIGSVLKVSQVDGTKNNEVKGDTKDFGKLVKDGIVDFGLVMPGISKLGLFTFDVSMVISPEVDTIRIVGRTIDLPSNLTLPKQNETYILPITLNKPFYRSFVRKNATYKFIANHGKFPLKQVIDDIRDGKSIFEVINLFSFVGGGFRNVEVKRRKVRRQHISVSEMKYTDKVKMKAAKFGKTLEMVSIGMIERDGLLFPTDLKRLRPSESMELHFPPTALERHVLSIFRKATTSVVESFSKDFMLAAPNNLGQISLVFQKANDRSPPKHLSLIAPPQVTGLKFTAKPPKSRKNIDQIATYVIYSEIEKIKNGKNPTIERRTRLWEVFNPGWATQIDLPKISFNKKNNRTYRWEVMYLGRDANKSKSFHGGVFNLNDITHVSRNSVDI